MAPDAGQVGRWPREGGREHYWRCTCTAASKGQELTPATQDYIKQLIGILNQAEDLESINDLHALCSLMQTIRAYRPLIALLTIPCAVMFNDNGIFEYILQDDIFMGVLGMLECASYAS